MELTCENCGQAFEKTNKRGPKPKHCSAACKQAKHRQSKSDESPSEPPRQGLTLRDVVNIASLDLSVRQCEVVIDAFTKARLRAAKRERDRQDA